MTWKSNQDEMWDLIRFGDFLKGIVIYCCSLSSLWSEKHSLLMQMHSTDKRRGGEPAKVWLVWDLYRRETSQLSASLCFLWGKGLIGSILNKVHPCFLCVLASKIHQSTTDSWTSWTSVMLRVTRRNKDQKSLRKHSVNATTTHDWVQQLCGL